MSTISMSLYKQIIICIIFELIFIIVKKQTKQTFFLRELTETTFNKTITHNDFVLVAYYTSDCVPCENFLPDFEYAGDKARIAKPPVLFAKVNCANIVSKKLCYDITKIPVIKFYKFGRYAGDFQYKEKDNMARFATRFVSSSPEKILSKTHYLNYLESTTYAVIGMFKNECKLKQAFMNVTILMFERFDYAYTFSKEVLEYQNVKQGIIVFKPEYMRNKFEETYSVYNDDPDIDKIRNFILRNYHGLVGFRRPGNRHDFNLPLLTVFYDFDFAKNKLNSTSIRNIMLEVAHKYRKYLNFCMCKTTDWSGLLEKFGYIDADSRKPITTIMDANERKYIMEENFSLETLENFVLKFINQSLIPFIRSAPIPSTKNDLIVEVVAKNFENTVMNNNRDIVLYIYNPSCIVCAKMEVAYKKLAEDLKKENIIFCAINGVVNDIPKLVKPVGFPTIYFLLKNNHYDPVMYTGGPDLHELIIFVSRHSTEELKKYDRNGEKKNRKIEL